MSANPLLVNIQDRPLSTQYAVLTALLCIIIYILILLAATTLGVFMREIEFYELFFYAPIGFLAGFVWSPIKQARREIQLDLLREQQAALAVPSPEKQGEPMPSAQLAGSIPSPQPEIKSMPDDSASRSISTLTYFLIGAFGFILLFSSIFIAEALELATITPIALPGLALFGYGGGMFFYRVVFAPHFGPKKN